MRIRVSSTFGGKDGKTAWARVTVNRVAAGDGRRSARLATALYIEDNPANPRLMEQILAADAGLRLFTASAGGLGISLACDRRPDPAVFDTNLHGMKVTRR